MIGDRERKTLDDLGAVWMGHGVELAARLNALAEELIAYGHPIAAGAIRDVLTCEYNPLPDDDTELGDPPTATAASAVRPAVPDLGIRLRTGPNEARLRRGGEPGA